MIAYPTVSILLARYGNTTAGRVAAREAIARAVRAGAEREVVRAGRSVKCGERGDHARKHPEYGRVGCGNDGSNCICECHDEVTPDA